MTREATDSAYLRPPAEASTDPARIREWWATPSDRPAAVLAVTGPSLGVVSIHAGLAEGIAAHKWFECRPTPVLAVSEVPIAFFFVRPPFPPGLTRDEVRVFSDGSVLPLPPSAIGEASATWLVTPEEAGRVLLSAGELAQLVASVKGDRA